jgi:coiled-coil domain-containing protein 77
MMKSAEKKHSEGQTDSPPPLRPSTTVIDTNDTTALLAYYRSRLTNFDEERISWVAALERMKMGLKDKHRKENEVVMSRSRIAELQSLICEENLALYMQREENLRTELLNILLKIDDADISKQMQDLIDMVSKAKTRGQQTDKRDLRPGQASDVYEPVLKSAASTLKSYKQPGTGTFGKQVTGKIKAEYSASQEKESDTIKCQVFKDAIERTQAFYREYEQMLENEIGQRRRELNVQQTVQVEVLNGLQQREERLKKLFLALSRQRLTSKQEQEKMMKKLVNEREELELKNEGMTTKLQDLQHTVEVERAALKEMMQKQTEEYMKTQQTKIEQFEANLSKSEVKAPGLASLPAYLDAIWPSPDDLLGENQADGRRCG